MYLEKPKTSFDLIETATMQVVGIQGLVEAAKLKLFDPMDGEVLGAEELAAQTGTEPAILSAMLDMFVSMGIVEKSDSGYTNSAVASEYLVSSSPFFQGKAISMMSAMCSVLGAELPLLLKGETQKRESTDKSWATQETMEGTLQHALDGQLQGAVEYISAVPEFKSFRKMADIGGNHCQYSMEFMKLNEHLDSTVFDLPHVVPAALERCENKGFAERVSCNAFDLRSEKLPQEAFDFIFSSHVLYGCLDMLDDLAESFYKSLNSGGVFASHHFAPECGATEIYRSSVNLVTRLSGYDAHFISRDQMEASLKKAGFVNMEHTVTGAAGRTLLLIARKP